MPKGFVTLVGAGPGDPGLLTLAGKQALAEADVVLFDRLVGDDILAMTAPSAECIDVGKHKGNHPVPQHAINELLLTHALAGKRVVRLKGGDPYLFGRGAEELALLREQAIPFRIIPGISSAIAAPAYAGIPITHRKFASSVHILTGHGKEGNDPDIPYAELARLRGTLVFLMGLSALRSICHGLLAAGMDADTPAAVVENGTRDNQRKHISTLACLPDEAAQLAFSSPAVVVVGNVCLLADSFDWHELVPFSRPVLCVSSASTGGRLAQELRSRGCRVDTFTGIRMEANAEACGWEKNVHAYQWIVLTSQYGVDLFFNQLEQANIDLRHLAQCKFAAVGSRTAGELRKHGLFADIVPEEYSGNALAQLLCQTMKKDEHALLFRAEQGNPEIADALHAAGLAFTAIPAYRTVQQMLPDDVAERVRTGVYGVVTFSSASAADALARGYNGTLENIPAVCIGEMTAAAARKYGMNALVSPVATTESMAETVLSLLETTCI